MIMEVVTRVTIYDLPRKQRVTPLYIVTWPCTK